MKVKPKCCYDHWEATNRALRRRADRACQCRGQCGCREKHDVYEETGSYANL